MSWNMQRTDLRELVRIAKHVNADIVIGQETGIPNNEFRELDGYLFWTAGDGKEKVRRGKNESKSQTQTQVERKM